MRYRLILLICLFLFSCARIPILRIDFVTEEAGKTGRTQAFDITHIYHQVTTHPEIDAYPAISPDGKWIAFSSRRSGNMDIWIKPVIGGSAIQITNHRADDVMPAWSPDGKNLVFVSYREDAAGDLWMIALERKQDKFSVSGDPRKLTDYLGMDISPAFSPDGKYIAFSSDRDEKPNIYLYQFKNRRIFQITQDGGFYPTWSPDGKKIAFVAFQPPSPKKGQIFYVKLSFEGSIPVVTSMVPVTTGQSNDAFPCWNPIKDEIFFNRYDHDTNQDGHISPDDKPDLWKTIFIPQNRDQAAGDASGKADFNRSEDKHDFQEIQLIPTVYGDYYPVCSRDSLLYFVSNRSGNDDIWSIPANGVIPRQNDGFMQYQFSLSYFPLALNDLVLNLQQDAMDSTTLLYRLLAFQRVIDFHPDENNWVGWSLYEIARTYRARHQFNLAKAYFHEILTQFLDFPLLVGKTELRLFELNFQNSPDQLDDQIDQLTSIMSIFQGKSEIEAEALLLMGEVYFLYDRYSRSLQVLEQLISGYPDQIEKCARAQILIGDIYTKFGQTEEVIRAFLRVIQNYPEQDMWVETALNRILALESSVDFYSLISNYRNMIARYGEYHRLAARAQVQIGEQFFIRKDYDSAIEELNIVSQKYPDQRDEVARAELMLAKVFFDRGEDLRAINQYKKVIKDFGDVQSGLFVVQAKEELLAIYLDTGRQFRLAGELQAAYSRYRDAITIFPRNLDAHRGLVASMYGMGQIDQAIPLYEKLQSENPDDEILLYISGLGYSYQATELSDRTKTIENFDILSIKKSNALIEAALSKNYRLVQAYLTLSYNYEFIEKYESALAAKKQNFLVSLARAIVAPVKSFVYWITFRKEKPPQQWFEKAIDALTTAIALNDEKENRQLESELALNLAGNYYNLGEFGFERAYHYYHVKLEHDSTFASPKLAADVYKRMGHCALVVEDFVQGPNYLKRALDLYRDLGDNENWLLNIKRLALLYQLAGNYDEAVDYLKIAAGQDEKAKRYNQLSSAYRSIAYNYQLLNDEEQAIRYAYKSYELIRSGKVEEVKARPNWIKIGILGIEFPVWNLGQIGAGASTAAEGFTTAEEIAFLYSILGAAALKQRSIPEAIAYLEKKIDIYRQRKDKIAEAIFLNNIGYLYYWDFNYPRAWEYFEKSFKICKKENVIPGMLINIIDLASLAVIINKLAILNSSLIDSTQPNPQDRAIPSAYLASSLDYLRSGLLLYDQEPIGFLNEKTQIYTLLGNLHYLKNLSVLDSLKEDRNLIVQKQIDRLEDLAIADSCYASALKLAQAHYFKIDHLFILQNLATLSLDLGDVDDGRDYLYQARELAIEENLSAWLWRVDLALGQVLSFYKEDTVNDQIDRDASFYLNEAITVVEQSALQLQTFRVTPFYCYQIRLLYQTAIDYNISRGNLTGALRLTEQYRGKQYLDIVGSHKIELKKELHKLHLGNARFLAQEINNWNHKIRIAKEKANTPPPEIASWLQERHKLEDEYQKLIEKLKQEDPELEAFVYVEPIIYSEIQKILSKNSTIINYFISKNKLYIWTITAASVKFLEIPINNQELANRINVFVAEITDSSIAEPQTDNLWQLLIQPVASQIDSFTQVVIVTDGMLSRIPFSYLLNFISSGNSQLKTVVTVPGLSNYFYSFQKRKIRGTNLLWPGVGLKTKFEDWGYNVEELTDNNNSSFSIKDQIKARMQNSDMIYLQIAFNPNENDPLISSVTLRSPKKFPSFQIREFYNVDLKSSVVILTGLTNKGTLSILTLQKVMLYAGTPSLITSLWPSQDESFWEYFFEALVDYPAAEALLRAQLKMRQRGSRPVNYAGYQLIGFEGMTDEQEFQFAEESFVSKVAIGNRYAEDHDWLEAIANYEQALIMARKQGDTRSIENLYQFIIESAANGHLYDIAITYQLESVDMAKTKNDLQKLAEGYNYLVYFYTESKNYDQAAHYQNEYLNLAQQYDLRAEVAGSYHKLGLVYERGGNYGLAIDYFTKAIQSFRELGDSTNVAACLKDRGRIYFLNLDNYSNAIDNQEQALRIFQSQNDTQGALEVLQNLGWSHELLANYQTALDYQIRAYKLAQQSGNSYWIAVSQQHLANVSWKMGDYEQALQYQKQALQLCEASTDFKLQSVQPVGFSTLGLIYMSLGNMDEAIQNEQRALELAQNITARQDVANIHKNLGLMYRAQSRWDEALEQFQQAVKMDSLIDSRRGLGYGYLDIGSIYLQQGKINQALNHFRSALKIGQEIFDGRNQVLCLYHIGKAYAALKQYNIALDTLVLAADKAEQMFIPEVEWRSRRLMGQLYRETNNFEQSLAAFHQAVSIIETMRSQIKVEEYKSGFIDDKLDAYYDLVELYLKLDQPAKAVEIVERAKSRNFLDLLANRNIKFRGQVSEQKIKQGESLQNEMRRVQNEISGLIVKGDKITVPEREKLNILTRQLKDLKGQYQDFLVELKEQNAELSEMVTVAPPNMDSMRTILPDSVILLEYFYTSDKLFTWSITRHSVAAKQRSLPQIELVTQVETFRKAIEEQKSVLGISQTLYNLLISPFENDLARSNHIVIIPHGILHYLPYAALADNNQKFLNERYSLSLAPSATVLDICMKKGQPFVSNKNWTPEILALGDPNLNNPQLELPFAEKEIQSVQLIYSEVTSYLHSQATETIFKQSCAAPNMILFSCHGEFDAANPLFSSLLLAPDQENDGRLQAHEIFGFNMNTYLVAMSACETGLAKISVGDEVIGLSRSFIYAGSSSLLSSLWKVDDLATAVLIKRFFRYLREGNSRARALQKAINLVRTEINIHPAYWAAFNLTGDFR